MFIKCWGARGSTPVSGMEYIKYGGATTCFEIRSQKDDIVIVDAGTGIRRLGKDLIEENRHDFTLIFTHVHWDHILGFPFFKPIYLPQTRIDMYGCSHASASIDAIIAQTMQAPYFPIPYGAVAANIVDHGECDQTLQVGSMQITPIALSHPNGGSGFAFAENGRRLVFLTDNELAFQHPGGLKYEDYLQACQGADLLIHDAEFTEEEYQRTKTWGHSTYRDALKLAIEAGVQQFGLIHHNQDRDDEGIDRIVADCRSIIARKRSPLQCFAVHQGMEIRL